MYAPVIGIDFGTTKTLVTYPTGEGNKPEIAHLGRERNSLPTSAFIGESGIWEFGEDADDYACDPALADRYISGFKLKLGSTIPSLQVFGTQGFQAFSAQRISALFFAHVREKCTKEVFNGRAVSRAVITHPVKFSPAQLHDLRNAAEQAGFSDVTLMREPEAAGLAFCRLCPQDLFSGTALIVDWGGGTLDLALVSRKTDSVQIHNNYVAGHNHIGGNEFDELLWKYVNARLQHEKGVKLSEDSVDFQRLQKKKIRAAKEKLSRTDSAMLGLSGKQGAYPPLKLTREELETVLKPAVQTGVDLICNLLNTIQEGSLKPSQILLIGGSSQIPLISRLIEESSKIPCRRWQYSHEAVALGAALGIRSVLKEPRINDNQWNKIAQQWGRELAPISFQCKACNLKVSITEKSGECQRCGMQYTRTGNQSYQTKGVTRRCSCGHVMTLLGNKNRCDKCGSMIRWDYSGKKWVTEISFPCKVCNLKVSATEKTGVCKQCRMQYTRTGNQSYQTKGLNKRCSCGHVMTLLSDKNRCDKCGSMIRWDYLGKKWVTERSCQHNHEAVAFGAALGIRSILKEPRINDNQWNKIAQQRGRELAPISFQCKACNLKVSITEKSGECQRCGMQYTRTGNQSYQTKGLNKRCSCGHVMTLLGNKNRCDKCGSMIRWDYSGKEWVIY